MRWGEFATRIRIPVYNGDWESARSIFENKFKTHPALREMIGYWSPVRDGVPNKFKS